MYDADCRQAVSGVGVEREQRRIWEQTRQRRRRKRPRKDGSGRRCCCSPPRTEAAAATKRRRSGWSGLDSYFGSRCRGYEERVTGTICFFLSPFSGSRQTCRHRDPARGSKAAGPMGLTRRRPIGCRLSAHSASGIARVAAGSRRCGRVGSVARTILRRRRLRCDFFTFLLLLLSSSPSLLSCCGRSSLLLFVVRSPARSRVPRRLHSL